MAVAICVPTPSLLKMSRSALTSSEKKGLESVRFDSTACTRYVNGSSASLQEDYAASVSCAYLQPHDELLHVSEEGKLEQS